LFCGSGGTAYGSFTSSVVEAVVLGAGRGGLTSGSFCRSGQLITPSSVSNCENRLRVNFHAIKAMAPSAASPPATDKPTMVLVETPELPLLAWLGGDGVALGVSPTETTTSLVMVITWPSCCVLSILVRLVDGRRTRDAEDEVAAGGAEADLDG
jgi:hypothetical protein